MTYCSRNRRHIVALVDKLVCNIIAVFNLRPCGEFSQKCDFCENSLLLYLPAVLGGGGTEAAGYQPSDVCTLTVQDAQLAYKLELTIVQGCTMVNGWHMLGALKSFKDFNAPHRLYFR